MLQRVSPFAAALSLAGCASTAASPGGDGADLAPPPSVSSEASTSAGAPIPPAPSAEVTAKDACLMLYECGCNSGCVSVEAPRHGVREGDLVLVKTGPWKGKEVWVAKRRTATGEEILTAQQRDPKQTVEVCGRPMGNALGYLCASDGFGPPHGCTTCPSE